MLHGLNEGQFTEIWRFQNILNIGHKSLYPSLLDKDTTTYTLKPEQIIDWFKF